MTNKYENGKIYTIKCRNNPEYIYVGSTIQPLSLRFNGHKSLSRCNNSRKLYQVVNGNWENWYIDLYKDFPCLSQQELHREEGNIIKLIGNLNTVISGRTKKEYRIDNFEKLSEINRVYLKTYYQENKEKYKERLQEYRKTHNKEIDPEKAKKIKEYQKQYRINNLGQKKK